MSFSLLCWSHCPEGSLTLKTAQMVFIRDHRRFASTTWITDLSLQSCESDPSNATFSHRSRCALHGLLDRADILRLAQHRIPHGQFIGFRLCRVCFSSFAAVGPYGRALSFGRIKPHCCGVTMIYVPVSLDRLLELA